jgi:hypothetical protein
MNRKVLWSLLVATGLGMPFAAPVRAHSECARDCKDEQRTCGDAAKEVKATCKLDCDENATEEDLPWCLRGCNADFRADYATCRVDSGACRVDCKKPNGGDPECRGICGTEFGDCLGSAAGSFIDCQRGCPKDEARPPCIEGCQKAQSDEAAGCKGDHESCFAGCGDGTTSTTLQNTTTTTTSETSTTTTTRPPSCHNSGAPTCGGACSDPLATCLAIKADQCACVVASTTGAFTGSSRGRGNS